MSRTLHFFCLISSLFCSPFALGESLHIASLNPIVSDVARRVGGDAVKVTSLLQPGADPHAFRPTPADYALMSKADLVLAAGKGLETGLADLKASLQSVPVIEVGSVLSNVDTDHEHHAHCVHPHGQTDPHWWHSVHEVKRASRFLAHTFSSMLPDKAQEFSSNYQTYRDELNKLDQWIHEELSTIPPSERILATAHSAFNFFCRDYGFTPVSVQGLNPDQSATATHIQEVITLIRQRNLRVVFPEFNSNPKVLRALVQETDVQIGPPLLADTLHPEQATYIGMMRYNVGVIRQGFSSEESRP